ncbi:hypothetical protein M918_01595 [Clostridium sp. BL8]|nr:hypothetical protein M918_01595 [Clostridium sp. BL8]
MNMVSIVKEDFRASSKNLKPSITNNPFSFLYFFSFNFFCLFNKIVIFAGYMLQNKLSLSN